MKPIDINFKEEVPLDKILYDFVEDITEIPIEEGKAFFRRWMDSVPAKLIRSCIFAGIHYALKNKDNLEVKWANGSDYICPECGGPIEKIIIKDPHAWRWTCRNCQRDFGYNTEEPMTKDTETMFEECGIGDK